MEDENLETPKFNFKKAIIVGAIFLIIIFYGLYQAYGLIKNPTNTVTVFQGSVQMSESTVGYIIREEIVEKGENYQNGMEEIKTEGEKVAKNGEIFRYYGDNEQTLTDKINDLNSQIQNVLANSMHVLNSNDIVTLDNKIDAKLEAVKNLRDIQDISEYKKDINTLLSKKLELISNYGEIDEELKNLIEQKKQCESELTDGGEYVTATESGIVSYRVDGLEEIFNTQDFSYLNLEFLENLNLKTGQIVASNNECAKVVNNYKGYIAFFSKSSEADFVSVGNKITIRLSTGDEVEAEIVYIESEENGKIVVVQISKCVDKLISYRKVSIDVVWWSDSGLKVPNSAIAEKDGLYYVVRNRIGYLNKIVVKVLRKNENYSIVTNYTADELKEIGFGEEVDKMKKLKLYDELTLEPNLSVEF